MADIQAVYTTQPGVGWSEDLPYGWYASVDGVQIAQPLNGWGDQNAALAAAAKASAPGSLALGDFRQYVPGDKGNVNVAQMNAYFDYLRGNLDPASIGLGVALPAAQSSALNMGAVDAAAADAHKSDANYSNGPLIGIGLVAGIGALANALAGTAFSLGATSTPAALAPNAAATFDGFASGLAEDAAATQSAFEAASLSSGLTASGAAWPATLAPNAAATFDGFASGLAEDAGMSQTAFEASNLGAGLTASGAAFPLATGAGAGLGSALASGAASVAKTIADSSLAKTLANGLINAAAASDAIKTAQQQAPVMSAPVVSPITSQSLLLIGAVALVAALVMGRTGKGKGGGGKHKKAAKLSTGMVPNAKT